MKFVLLIAALAAVAVATTQEGNVPVAYTRSRTLAEDSFLWGSWKAQHKKTYRADEEAARFAIFQANLDFVEKWNSEGHSHTVAMNHLADLSNEEYQRLYLGARTTVNNYQAVQETPKAYDPIDWRKKGYVTPIKDQGQCGSCYAFSAIGSAEGAHFKKTGTLVSLSEKNIVDCSAKYGNQGCNGGLMTNAFDYIIANHGVDTEEAYPYKAQSGKCQFKSSNVGATLSNYTSIAQGSEDGLQKALSTEGPISIAIDASHQSFQLYSSGVYVEQACSSSALDHGVLAVGIDTDSKGGDYYIVKNSWGTSWGQQGYIWMARNKSNQCGVATMASYPIA